MRPADMRHRIAALIAVCALSVIAWWLPQLRRTLIRAVVTFDAPATEPAPLPGGSGPGLSRVSRTRVVLIDGLSAKVAKSLPVWSALCKTGATLEVEVGFPTVSLPVEVALWTGLTQQQTGVVYRSGRPLSPPLDRHGIPAQVPGSWAIAESHGYIVRSLGFSRVEPPADPAKPAKDAEPELWGQQ
nr:alkaline phosphatase family protein [Deltaproteobacteria bacterium]